MADNKQLYTPEGFKELQDELNYLKTVKREEIKEAIAVAKSFGDLSENSEYDEARTEQAKTEARITELQFLVENAVVVDESKVDTSIISLGSTVVLYDVEDEEEINYSIVGSNETNPLEGKISDQSPIGKALMGKREGDSVSIETPAGTLKFNVLKVARVSKTKN
jgi:transcription elongation factor GreA